MKTLLQEDYDLRDRLSELTWQIVQDLAQYSVEAPNNIEVLTKGSVQVCVVCGVEIEELAPRLAIGRADPKALLPRFVCVDRASCALRQADRRDAEIRERIRGRRDRLELLRQHVRLDTIAQPGKDQTRDELEAKGDPADRGLCPYYNSHDGSCMHDGGLDLCCSHEPGWYKTQCPIIDLEKEDDES